MGMVIDGNKQDEAAQMLARSVRMMVKAGCLFIKAGREKAAQDMDPHVRAIADIACRFLPSSNPAFSELSKEVE
jgi:hypothetical protein